MEKTFDDIERLAAECKFSDCTHTAEPGCAVQRAVQLGTLDSRRFENYMKLKTETNYAGLNAKQIENKKFEHLGGVKNLRKTGTAQRKNKRGED